MYSVVTVLLCSRIGEGCCSVRLAITHLHARTLHPGRLQRMPLTLLQVLPLILFERELAPLKLLALQIRLSYVFVVFLGFG